VEKLPEVKRQFSVQAEEELVRLALAVAKKIIRREVRQDTAVLAASLREILEWLSAGGQVAVRVAEAELARWKTYLPEMAVLFPGEGKVRLAPDPSLKEGDFVVENGETSVDARMDRVFQELERVLVE
jgi:flagellar assembly protein FliH